MDWLRFFKIQGPRSSTSNKEDELQQQKSCCRNDLEQFGAAAFCSKSQNFDISDIFLKMMDQYCRYVPLKSQEPLPLRSAQAG